MASNSSLPAADVVPRVSWHSNGWRAQLAPHSYTIPMGMWIWPVRMIWKSRTMPTDLAVFLKLLKPTVKIYDQMCMEDYQLLGCGRFWCFCLSTIRTWFRSNRRYLSILFGHAPSRTKKQLPVRPFKYKNRWFWLLLGFRETNFLLETVQLHFK